MLTSETAPAAADTTTAGDSGTDSPVTTGAEPDYLAIIEGDTDAPSEDAAGDVESTPEPRAEAAPEPKAEAPDAPKADTIDALNERSLEALAAKSRKIKAEQEEFAQMRRELEARAKQADEIQAAIRNRDYRALERWGFSADDVINHVLSTDEAPKTAKAEPQRDPEVESLRERLDRLERERQEIESAQRINQAKTWVREQVAGGDYAITNALGAHEAVWNRIVSAHQNDGLELDPRQAASEVEKELRSQIETVVKANPDLIRSMLGGATAGAKTPAKKSGKTLNNNLAADAPAPDEWRPDPGMDRAELDRMLAKML